jgi:hypothetical protein
MTGYEFDLRGYLFSQTANGFYSVIDRIAPAAVLDSYLQLI